MPPKTNTQPVASTTDAPTSTEIAPVGAVAAATAMPPVRTPETVPVPGGGQWAWNDVLKDWEDKNPKPAKPAEPPAEAAAA